MKNSIAVFLICAAATLQAQDFKIQKSTGKLDIKEVNRVTLEGYDGNEIIFSSLDAPKEENERAKGLRAISSMGLEDNTGLGLSVVDKGGVIEVRQMRTMDGPKVKIRVPKGVSVTYAHTSPHGSNLKVANLESELEVSTVHVGVILDNATGPLTLNTVHGKIEAVFGNTIKSPISMVSAHGLIDVTLPLATKANLSLSTGYGEIFVDPAIKIDFDTKSEWKVYGGNKVDGKINGGGLDIKLSTNHNNIYLRKK
jgi:hypothetical protein